MSGQIGLLPCDAGDGLVTVVSRGREGIRQIQQLFIERLINSEFLGSNQARSGHKDV